MSFLFVIDSFMPFSSFTSLFYLSVRLRVKSRDSAVRKKGENQEPIFISLVNCEKRCHIFSLHLLWKKYHPMPSEAPEMNNEVYNHFLTSEVPAEIAEHLKDVCPEFGDLNIEELLLMQESAFQFIQNNNRNRDTTSSSGETSYSLVLELENEPSHGASVERQLALDEAFAKSLELEDDFNKLYDNEDGISAVDNTRSTTRETPTRVESQNTRQDEIDPDRMTYEELQSLGESVGSESKGLPADLISRLPTFRYKTGAGLFLKKKKKEKEECVICCEGYKNGAKLTALPCAHQYHSNCITPWLQHNKQCPICQKEVEDE